MAGGRVCCSNSAGSAVLDVPLAETAATSDCVLFCDRRALDRMRQLLHWTTCNQPPETQACRRFERREPPLFNAASCEFDGHDGRTQLTTESDGSEHADRGAAELRCGPRSIANCEGNRPSCPRERAATIRPRSPRNWSWYASALQPLLFTAGSVASPFVASQFLRWVEAPQ